MAEGEPGICRVMCFSPRHDLTLSSMSVPEIEEVVRTWTSQFSGTRPRSRESAMCRFSRTAAKMMGASNPHPHCQIWATASIPEQPAQELDARQISGEHGSCLLCDYMSLEQSQASPDRLPERRLRGDGPFLGGVAV